MVGRKGKGNRMFAKRLDAIPGFLRPWEPVRRTIARLAAGERCAVTQFSGKLGISQAGVSKRIRVLVDAGLQSKTRQGRYRWCRFRPSALSQTRPFIEERDASKKCPVQLVQLDRTNKRCVMINQPIARRPMIGTA